MGGRKSIFALVIFFSSILTHPSFADDRLTSFGTGAGATYGGVGFNIALKREYDLRYLAIGCFAFGYSEVDGVVSACGVGVGWINAHLVTQANEKHGVGIHLGSVGFHEENSIHLKLSTVYGIGLTYAYYFSGIGKGSWNLGLTPALGFRGGEVSRHVLIQIGYQF